MTTTASRARRSAAGRCRPAGLCGCRRGSSGSPESRQRPRGPGSAPGWWRGPPPPDPGPSTLNDRSSSASRTRTNSGSGGGASRLRSNAGGRGIIEITAAPHEAPNGIEPVLFQRLDQGRIERRATGRGPERAVLHVPSRPAGDLAELGRQQVTMLAAVELPPAGKGDMGDVHVQSHADGVGGHQVVDLAGFVQRDLRVAGARAEGAEHDCRTAVPPAHLLGDPVDIVGGKGDDGRAPRQAGQLALAAPAQGRKPGPLLDFGAWQDAPEKSGAPSRIPGTWFPPARAHAGGGP